MPVTIYRTTFLRQEKLNLLDRGRRSVRRGISTLRRYVCICLPSWTHFQKERVRDCQASQLLTGGYMVMLGFADEGRYWCAGNHSNFEWRQETTTRRKDPKSLRRNQPLGYVRYKFPTLSGHLARAIAEWPLGRQCPAGEHLIGTPATDHVTLMY